MTNAGIRAEIKIKPARRIFPYFGCLARSGTMIAAKLKKWSSHGKNHECGIHYRNKKILIH